MATYYITGIKKSTVGNHTYISVVLLHEVNNTVSVGRIMNKDEVIRLIKANNNIYSATWNYTDIGWTRQELVSYENRGGYEYLRTTPDNSQRDNLLHLIPIDNLGL